VLKNRVYVELAPSGGGGMGAILPPGSAF
jgi:hypothetical protein